MKRYISLILATFVIISVLTFVSCSESKGSTIEKIEFCRKADYILTVGESDTEYVYVKTDGGSALEGSIIFISENDNVADIEATSFSTALVGYSVTARGEGETFIYAVSADGNVFSEKMKVTVIENVETKFESDSVSETESETETSTEATTEAESEPKPTESETTREIFFGTATQTVQVYYDETETSFEDTTQVSETTTVYVEPTEVPTEEPETTTQLTERTTETTTKATTTAETTKATSKTTAKDTEEPKEIIYIINTNSKKIHRQSCYAAARIKDENRGEVSFIDDLLASGYEWCKICK